LCCIRVLFCAILVLESLACAGLESLDVNLKNRLLALQIRDIPLYETPAWRALLHYQNHRSSIQKDSPFFLSTRGYKDSKAEYIATIEGIFATYANKEDSVICAYPARTYFIAKILQDEQFSAFVDNTQCKGLQEFLAIVPVDEVFIEFAAESDKYPGSSMGHIFLHLRGVMREDYFKQIDEHTSLNLKKGDVQSYSISYFANLSPVFNPFDYVRALYGNLNGMYALEPYDNTNFEYIENQKRSIYRFRLASRDMELLRLHLWELKDKSIDYAFITHNCTNAIEELTNILDLQVGSASKKPFITPIEYLQSLHRRDMATLDEVFIPEDKREFVQVYGYNDILNARKSSKISIGLENAQESLQGFLSIAPIYSDVKNADNSYYEFIESRLGSIEARVQDSQIFLQRIELMHLYSVLDFVRTKNFSKLLSVRFEPNLYNHTQGEMFAPTLNKQTRLLPTLDIGMGFGAYVGNVALYILPNLGYRYEIIHNPYVSAKSGFIAHLPRLRILGDYSVYYDMVGNNRGYDSHMRVFVGLNVAKQIDIFVEGNMYHNLFATPLLYPSRSYTSLKGGVSVNF